MRRLMLRLRSIGARRGKLLKVAEEGRGKSAESGDEALVTEEEGNMALVEGCGGGGC